MIDIITILGLLLGAILIALLGKVLHIIVQILFYALLAAFVMIFFFGISLDQVLQWGIHTVLWVF
ncbi:hypothetical protein COV12_00060 [Candidatus Woesearchaeota archaeon CG10_big_fil_rev_8_21_14_0_10_32_24]|nr:MAG: hypothetical protein COV12_00060 [Candidatus Woesearchaeota archaeon CG10_big_fil_rev_8_21_14_0_10_32_24]